jgi:glycosyltransferase involved in cell wall biosynthesis
MMGMRAVGDSALESRRTGLVAQPSRLLVQARRLHHNHLPPTSHLVQRTTSLTRTLSVLLPVHNAQATLQTDVGEMLDLLPDLAHDFDLLIIDDGSTDATCEVAEELAKQFPQVKFVRHSRRRGIKAALNDGLARTQSRIVLGHNGQPRIDSGGLLQFWHCEAAPSSSKPIGRAGSFHLLRRDPAESTGVFRSIKRIERSGESIAANPRRPKSQRKPNFLRWLKDFATGE